MNTFRCPEWEAGRCDCPDGTVRLDCPGLRALEGEVYAPPPADDGPDGIAVAALIMVAVMVLCLLAGVAIGRIL